MTTNNSTPDSGGLREAVNLLAERICVALRGEGVAGHPGEMIAVSEAQQIVEEEVDALLAAHPEPVPTPSGSELPIVCLTDAEMSHAQVDPSAYWRGRWYSESVVEGIIARRMAEPNPHARRRRRRHGGRAGGRPTSGASFVICPACGTRDCVGFACPLSTPPADDANRAPVSGWLDLLSLFPLDNTGHVTACGWDDADEHPTCGCYDLPSRIADWLAARDAALVVRLAAAEGDRDDWEVRARRYASAAVEQNALARTFEAERDRARQEYRYAVMEASAALDAAEHIEAAFATAEAERDTARREAGERIARAIEQIATYTVTESPGHGGYSREGVSAEQVRRAAARIARADALTSDDGSGA